jgi:uncharacterized spore protein YtfJ
MQSNTSITENIDVLFSKLEKFLRSETVAGQPINLGETTIVPIATITFGCGTGTGIGGDGKDSENTTGSGLGVGAKVMPNAVLVIKKDQISMLPVKGKNSMSNFMEMVPEIISKLDLKNIMNGNKENNFHNHENKYDNINKENSRDIKHNDNIENIQNRNNQTFNNTPGQNNYDSNYKFDEQNKHDSSQQDNQLSY